MLRIFISYRRADIVASALLRSIDDRLVERFGRDNVFVDIDSIPLGSDFRETINREVSKCDVLLAMIGDRWIDLFQEFKKGDVDFVLTEIEAAITRHIPIIPLLIGGATMPTNEKLPDPIRDLAYKNGMEIDHARDFNHHMRRLVQELENLERVREAQEKSIVEYNGKHRVELSPTVFSSLQELLDNSKWKEADYLTGRIMLALSGRVEFGWLDANSIQGLLDNEDFQLLDELWVSHSNGHFGYTTQKNLYSQIGGKSEYDQDTWKRFSETVGWKNDGHWVLYNEMVFSLDAPRGHLPDGFVAVQYEDKSVVREWVLALV